jgi:ferredoxin-NADP reductase
MPEKILTLVETLDEGESAFTFVFSSPYPVHYTAGQYGHLRLSGLPPEARAVREFSFASAPHEEYIRFGIDMRSGSAYQKRLAEMREGDTAILFKIKGHMTWPAPENNSVMIAGGVGITPFRSMLLDRAQKKIGGRVRVIHVSSHAFIYKDKLLPLADEYSAVGRAELFGALDAAIRNAPSARFYVAGSRGFVAAVSARLAESGIRADSDEFKGLTDSDFTDAAT